MESVKIVDQQLFNEGCNAIFKRWTAFRMSLDDNPRVLKYYEDDGSLEINKFLEILFEDILNTIKKDKIGGSYAVERIADCLNGFITDYFSVGLEDGSDIEVGEVIYKLYNQLAENNLTLLNELKDKANKAKLNYRIDFPITGTQMDIDSDSHSNDAEDCNSNNSIEEVDEGNQNNINENNKKVEEDDDGFIVHKKGKGF